MMFAMKFRLALLFATMSIILNGQNSQNPFEHTFNGMFEPGDEWHYIPEGGPPPPPGVPLDGGLTALLLAGGAAGYRQYKKRNR